MHDDSRSGRSRAIGAPLTMQQNVRILCHGGSNLPRPNDDGLEQFLQGDVVPVVVVTFGLALALPLAHAIAAAWQIKIEWERLQFNYRPPGIIAEVVNLVHSPLGRWVPCEVRRRQQKLQNPNLWENYCPDKRPEIEKLLLEIYIS